MGKCQGITEQYWKDEVNEDERLFWKAFCRLLSLVTAVAVYKTGIVWFDWTLGALTAVFAFIIIETQRSYSKLSPRLRRRCVRSAIFLGSWGIAALGIVYFAENSVLAMADIFAHSVIPGLSRSREPWTPYLMLSLFLIAAPIGVMRVLRRLGIEHVIYHRPRAGLKRLLLHKYPRVTSFQEFAHVELAVIFASLIYASAFAAVAKPLLALA